MLKSSLPHESATSTRSDMDDVDLHEVLLPPSSRLSGASSFVRARTEQGVGTRRGGATVLYQLSNMVLALMHVCKSARLAVPTTCSYQILSSSMTSSRLCCRWMLMILTHHSVVWRSRRTDNHFDKAGSMAWKTDFLISAGVGICGGIH